MQIKMDFINQLNSPMIVHKENLTETLMGRTKTPATTQNREPPPLFLIGSIERVNQTISQMEYETNLRDCDNLVIESWEASKEILPQHDSSSGYKSSKRRLQKKNLWTTEPNKKDVESLPQESKHSINKPDSAKVEKVMKKMLISKPKLVELHPFPGFTDTGPMPLPHGISLSTITDNVLLCYKNSRGKICSSKVVRQTLRTSVAKALLLDCYWWIFLQMYKPEIESQRKLFDRVSKNYVQLLSMCMCSHKGEDFLKVYPSLLSQAVYSCFCYTFPQSLYKFQSDDFKSQLCNILWQWTGGICPSPESYAIWDCVSLEPKDIMVQGKEKQKKVSSAAVIGFGLSRENKQASLFPNDYSHIRNLSLTGSIRKTSTLSQKNPSLVVDPYHDYSQSMQGGRKQTKKTLKKLPSSKVSPAREAHIACSGPDLSKKLFNLNGHSPLVQYHLQKLNAEPRCGLNIFINRTEIQKQISYPFNYLSTDPQHRSLLRLHLSDILLNIALS